MRFQEPKTRTFVAASDLSTKAYHGVKFTANFNEVDIAGVGDAEGILMNCPKAGEAAEVAMIGGGALGHAGSAIAIGDKVSSDAAGKLVPASSGNTVVGKALSAAATDEYFEIERLEYVQA